PPPPQRTRFARRSRAGARLDVLRHETIAPSTHWDRAFAIPAAPPRIAQPRSALAKARCPRAKRVLCGGWGREGVRSEERAQQRLAPGGRASLPLTRIASRRKLYRSRCFR